MLPFIVAPQILQQKLELIISASVNDVDVHAELLSAGWNGSSSAKVVVTVQAGVKVGSSSYSTPSLNIQSSWPSGMSFTLYNYGKIMGAGGQGGYGANGSNNGGNPGTQGGTAIQTELPLELYNLSSIYGGGGGGGSGANQTGSPEDQSGGGGGGAGIVGGTKGGAGNTSYGGSNGTETAGGSGGGHIGLSGNGGAGGGPGLAGSQGSASNNGNPGAVGGAAGYALNGAGVITYKTSGDILGQVSTPIPVKNYLLMNSGDKFLLDAGGNILLNSEA